MGGEQGEEPEYRGGDSIFVGHFHSDAQRQDPRNRLIKLLKGAPSVN